MMNATHDYYRILGVSENAGLDAVKKAYRALALKYHPDRSAGADKSKAAEKFKEISEAYYVLSDTDRRREYDSYRSGAEAGQTGDFAETHGFDFDEILRHFRSSGDMFDIFDHLGGGGRRHYVYGSGRVSERDRGGEKTDIRADITIPPHILRSGGRVKFRHEGKDMSLRIAAGTKRDQQLRLRGQGDLCPCCDHKGDLIVRIR